MLLKVGVGPCLPRNKRPSYIETRMRILRFVSENPDSRITHIMQGSRTVEHGSCLLILDDFERNGIIITKEVDSRYERRKRIREGLPTRHLGYTYRITPRGIEILRTYDMLIQLLNGAE